MFVWLFCKSDVGRYVMKRPRYVIKYVLSVKIDQYQEYKYKKPRFFSLDTFVFEKKKLAKKYGYSYFFYPFPTHTLLVDPFSS